MCAALAMCRSKELPSRNGSHAVRECDLLQQLDCAVAGGGAAGAHASTPSSDASHGHAK